MDWKLGPVSVDHIKFLTAPPVDARMRLIERLTAFIKTAGLTAEQKDNLSKILAEYIDEQVLEIRKGVY